MREERVLSQEIAAFEKRFDSWLANQSLARKDIHSVGHLSAEDKASSLPPAVLAYEVGLFVSDTNCTSVSFRGF